MSLGKQMPIGVSILCLEAHATYIKSNAHSIKIIGYLSGQTNFQANHIFLNSTTIVKPKQAGTCGRGTKYHPRCQISIYVQFSL